MSNITISDVARISGVSESTVSRVLNGTARVADAKRRAVERAIETLGFQPNAFARGLATGRSRAVGVVTQAIDSPFYGEGMRGIERTLQDNGYTPIFMSGHWNSDDEERCIRELIQRRVDGIILFAGRLDSARIAGFAQQVPVVVTGRRVDVPGVFSLAVDDAEGARMATAHLIDLGHRRIAFIGGPRDHPDAVARLSGYRQALEDAGIVFTQRLTAAGNFTEQGGLDAGERLLSLEEPFTAVFCANDQTAFGLQLALHRRGLRVPDDVSVVGFDDVAASAFFIPPLTTVRQPVDRMGELSAQALLVMIEQGQPRLDSPAVALVVRESSRVAEPTQRAAAGRRRPRAA
jgi:LacI family transcriptional regulator